MSRGEHYIDRKEQQVILDNALESEFVWTEWKMIQKNQYYRLNI